MKKQFILISLLLIVAVAVMVLSGKVFATDSTIQPRSMDEGITGTSEDVSRPGIGLPENEELGASLNEELQNIAATQKNDNRGAIVAGVVIITIVIIAGLVVWYYKTNY